MCLVGNSWSNSVLRKLGKYQFYALGLNREFISSNWPRKIRASSHAKPAIPSSVLSSFKLGVYERRQNLLSHIPF